MEFITRQGNMIDFDPFGQAAIDAAKLRTPGQGTGIASGGEKLATGKTIVAAMAGDELAAGGITFDVDQQG